MNGGDSTKPRLEAVTDTTATGVSEMLTIRRRDARVATLLALRAALDPFAEANEGNTLPSCRSLKWYPDIVGRTPASAIVNGTHV